MKIKFWGVRGSTPCPGPDTVKVGGNTACIELRYGNDDLIIIDAGSGIRLLGNELMKTGTCPKNIKIFITHTHSDHIMGIPFFSPLYVKGVNVEIYGPMTYEEDGLDKIISDQFSYRYFPVKHSELSAKITYIPLTEREFKIGDTLNVKTHYLNHPILTLGYRFEEGSEAVTTAYDTEYFYNLFPEDPAHPDYDQAVAEEGRLAAEEANKEFCNFIAGSDLLIYDSQYTEEELIEKYRGWGHSSFERAIQVAGEHGVKKLFFFHHAMERSDSELELLCQKYKKQAQKYPHLKVDLARENHVEKLS